MATFGACGDDTSDPLPGDGSGDGADGVDCEASDAPTYDNFGKAFMDDYCASCHAASVTGTARMGAPTEDVFDTLDQIQAGSDELVKEVVTEKAMPFGPASAKPSDEERALFGAWLECGAP